jgi:hypothetical protein
MRPSTLPEAARNHMQADDHMADAAVQHVPDLVSASPSFSGAELFEEWLLPNITTPYTGDISGAVAANGSFVVGPSVEVETVLGLEGEFNVSLDVTSDSFCSSSQQKATRSTSTSSTSTACTSPIRPDRCPT